MNELIAQLNESASAIAEHGHNGWGNLMINAAEELSKLESERDKLQADYNKAMGDVAMAREVLKKTREELRACQAAIHFSGDFDPRYVIDAQAAMKEADKIISATADSEAWLENYRKEVLEKASSITKHACWILMERTINRYLMANADGRQDGSLKAHCHIELCSTMIAVFRGLTFFETELIIHPEFAKVREATQELTDYMDEVIGFPLSGKPDYDALAPKFFEHFYRLAIGVLTESELRRLAASKSTEGKE